MATDLVHDLALVNGTLDAIGVEGGDLPIRLAWLRGACAVAGFRTRRTPSTPLPIRVTPSPSDPDADPFHGSTVAPLAAALPDVAADIVERESTDEVIVPAPANSPSAIEAARMVADHKTKVDAFVALVSNKDHGAEPDPVVTADPAPTTAADAAIVAEPPEPHEVEPQAGGPAITDDQTPEQLAVDATIARVQAATTAERVHPGTDVPFDLPNREPGGPYVSPEQKAADKAIAKAAKADARAAEKARKDAERAEKVRKQDPSWRDPKIRKGFFAALRDAGVTDKYEVIAAFAQSRGLPRPPYMVLAQRDRFLGAFRDPEKLHKFKEWAANHGTDMVAELAPTVDLEAELDTPAEWDTTEGAA